MRLKHSSDERLLALLDGELAIVRALQTRAHLRSCWECRARLARLEAAAQALAETRGKSQFLPQDRIDAARARFLARAGAREDTEPHAPGLPFRLLTAWSAAALGRRGVVLGCAGMLCLAAAVTVWHRSSPVKDAVVVASLPERQEPRVGIATPAESTPLALPGVTQKPSPGGVAGEDSKPDHTLEHETKVLSLLHEAGLCRGQAIRVDRSAGKLVVRGVVDTPAKREELLKRLSELDFEVITELRDLTEALEHAGPPGVESPAVERVTRVAAPGEPLIREWLHRQNLTGDAVAVRTIEVANASVRWADLAWAEAWALRELHHRFGPVWQDLPEPSRIVVLSMVRDHWSELRAIAARQRQVLGGVLPPSPASTADLLHAVEDWNLAVQTLFAPAEPVTVPASMLVAQISSSLARLESVGGDDEAELAAFFQDPSLIGRASVADFRKSK